MPGSLPGKKALGTALGFVLREAPQADAEALVTALAAAYADEAGHDETDAGVRVTAGLVLQEATHLAGDRLRPVLPAFLPVAYLAMWDSNPRAAEAWTDVWRASSGGDREGVNKYFPGILALLPPRRLAAPEPPFPQSKASGMLHPSLRGISAAWVRLFSFFCCVPSYKVAQSPPMLQSRCE